MANISLKKLLYRTITNCPFPVNSIFITLDEKSPSELYAGTTWERIGVGRTLISAGGGIDPTTDSNTSADHGTYEGKATWFGIGETGGEVAHTLSTGEMPKHAHGYSAFLWKNGQGGNDVYNMPSGNYKHNSSLVTTEAGGNGAHNNMQPYLAVYMWKRTK